MRSDFYNKRVELISSGLTTLRQLWTELRRNNA